MRIWIIIGFNIKGRFKYKKQDFISSFFKMIIEFILWNIVGALLKYMRKFMLFYT